MRGSAPASGGAPVLLARGVGYCQWAPGSDVVFAQGFSPQPGDRSPASPGPGVTGRRHMVWYGALDAGSGGCEEHAVRGSAIDIQRTQVL